jgi:ribonuclease HIII
MNYVFRVPEDRVPELLEYYRDLEIPPTSPDIVKMFKSGDLTVAFYRTGKVLLQGSQARDDYLMWADILGFDPEPEPVAAAAAEPRRSTVYGLAAIGSDEVGTGDFFGPVVVAATYVDRNAIPLLEQLGIRDSKKLADEFVTDVAPRLAKRVPHVILTTDPAKYNDLVRQGFNMNKIKAYLHNHAIRKCLVKADGPVERVIVDEFCAPDLYFDYLKDVEAYRKVTFIQKGESAHLAVAAASVLARDAFLRRMDEISAGLGIRLPLGAGPAVDAIAKLVVLQKGEGILETIAKTNFKNMERLHGVPARNV